MATLDTILNIKVEGTSQMTQLKTAIDETSKQLKDFKAQGKETGESQAKFNAKVVEAETKLKGLRGELNKQKTDLIKNAKALGDNSKSYDSLTKQNAKLSAEMRKLGDPLGKNKQKFQELSGQIRKNTDQLKSMDSQMGRSQRNVGNYGTSIGKMTTLIGGAILVAQQLGRAIGSFVEFEFAIKQVGIISGATTEEMEKLTESAKELGRTTSFTAGEVAELQKELAKLGFDPTEINDMTSSILDLSFAFDIDLATSAERVGGVLKSFNLDASETTRVTDVLATGFANSALDMDKFNTAFPKVGAVANTVGFELEDVVALMGTLADRSLDASVIGTSLRNIFLKMADSTSPLAQALGDSVQSVDDLIPALQDLQASGIDVTEMLELTDTRSVTAFASLLDGSSTIDELNSKLKDAEGTTARFGEEMRDTMKGSIDEMSSSANGLMIELVDKLSPAITFLTDALSLLFSGLTFVVENLGKVALAIGAYTLATGVATVGTVSFSTAMNATRIGQIAYKIATVGATVATKAFSTAIKANPIGLLVSGLALGVGFLTDWVFGSDEATESTEELNAELENEVKELTEIEKIRKKAKEDQASEISRLKALTKEIKNGNRTLGERKDSLESFNKLAGTNITNLEDEAKLAKDLELAYDGAVEAIKRKIILQSTEAEATELIKQQLALEEELNLRKEKSIETQGKLNTLNEKYDKQNQIRIEKGLRSNKELIQDNQELGNSTFDLLTENEKLIETYKKQNDLQQDNLSTSFLFNDNIIQTNKDFKDVAKNTENIKKNFEDLLLNIEGDGEGMFGINLNGIDASSEAVAQSATAVREATSENEDAQIAYNAVLTQSNNITDQINALYDDQAHLLKGLNIDTSAHGQGVNDTATAYGLLKNNVRDAQKALNDEVALSEQRVAEFLASEEAKTMSVEDRNKRVTEIEISNAKLIETATNKVISAKNDLFDVDDKLDEQQNIINQGTDKRKRDMEETILKTNERINQDKELIKSMDDLADTNEFVARRQIELALSVAKAELELFLQTISLYEGKTEANETYINTLLNNISEFEEELENMGGDGQKVGFLEKTLFGKDADGNGVTGEQLMQGINTTLNNVSSMLDNFNALQNERLNTRLGIIEADKDTEVAKFEATAEAEEMTAEEKADAIFAIEKTYNDQMLALKIEQFEKDQELARSQAFIGGAQAIMNILSGDATGNIIADAIIRGIMIGGVIATTATQISTINAQAPPTAKLGGVMDDSFFASGGMVHGRSHAQGGEKFAVGGRVAELEGGEAVINKRSTAMFKPMLSKINQAGGGRKFADGGMVFDVDSMGGDLDTTANIVSALNAQEVVLVESAVTQSQKTVKNIESRITF